MTQEQFDRVCEIVRYIDLLEFAKKEIRSFQNISHTFVRGTDIMKNGKF